jgi:microtubule-associated protein-like 6
MDMDPAVRSEALGDEAAVALAEVRTQAEPPTTRPWLNAIIEPQVAPPVDVTPPDASGALDRVLGVQVAAVRNAVAYNALGEAVWPTSSVAVVYTKATHEQRLFRGHTAEISSLAASRDGRFVATGERGQRPVVRVWDAQTCVELAVLGPFHRQHVSCVAWSLDGRRLVSVGGDVEHSVALWATATGGWDDARHMAYSGGDHQAVFFAAFLDPDWWGPGKGAPTPAGSMAPAHPGYTFATGGVDHVKLWCVEGRTLTSERCLWGTDAKVQPMLCGCAAGARLITGAVSGHLYVWRGRNCEKVIRAHETLVSCLWAGPTAVLSGGGDGFVKLYSPTLEHQRSYGAADAPTPPLAKAISGLCGFLDGAGRGLVKILVTTQSSECYEVAKVFSLQSFAFPLCPLFNAPARLALIMPTRRRVF